MECAVDVVDRGGSTAAEKYFISLSLPEELRVRLASVRNGVCSSFAHCTGGLAGPINPNKYHITLAVLLMPPNICRDLWYKITHQLASDVKTQLDIVEGRLSTSRVGKFGKGAVYLEVSDHDGALRYLHEIIIDSCKTWGVEVIKSHCFHITLFRQNNIELLSHDLQEDYGCPPVGFKVGAVQSGEDHEPVVNELFHGRVKG